MSIYIDRKFVALVSHRLLRYTVKSTQPFSAQFRCPFCGDSKKSETKTRGGLYEKDSRIKFKCFNCGETRSNVYNFLKDVDQVLAKEYITEALMDDRKERRPVKEETVKKEETRVSIDGLTRIDELKADHPVYTYLEKRKIPTTRYEDMFFVKKFNSWINERIPHKLKEEYDEPRLVLPFFDRDGKLFGVTGRSFNPKTKLRYVTIMFDENENKFFGLNKVDFTKKYYITEGAIDAFFLNNSLAMAGADAVVSSLPNKTNRVIVLDNEPRNVEIHKRMSGLIKSGERICIWPSHIKPKDINDMILSGITNVEEIIDSNTYSGLMATAQLSFWTKS